MRNFMKILIDEQLPTKLKYRFSDTNYDVFTVRDMGWLGAKNGELLELMLQHNFDLLITNDKNLYYQQKITSLKVCILNISAKTNRYADVMELMDLIKIKLKEIENYLAANHGGYFIV